MPRTWFGLLLVACASPPTTPTAIELPSPPDEAVAHPVQAVVPPVDPAAEPPAAPLPTPIPPTTPAPALEPGTCHSSADCEGGVCEGLGCDDAHRGVCAPKMRPCTRDLRAFCGCDAVTFRSSSSCVGQRYASVGPCS